MIIQVVRPIWYGFLKLIDLEPHSIWASTPYNSSNNANTWHCQFNA